MKEWFELIDTLTPSIVKIETPGGYGTGFLCARNEDKSIAIIATALHVIEEADKWQQPIRIHNVNANRTIVLQEADRVIWPEKSTDSAAILIFSTDKMNTLQLPEEPIPFIAAGKHLKVGIEVAWLGYPGIGPETLCFFSGKISAWQQKTSSYLIDGVAINGVSGGPVFYRKGDSARVFGAITAYMPNRLTGSVLPGLSVAQDVSHFQNMVTYIKDRDEAARKKKEQEAAAQQTPETPGLAEPAAPTPKIATSKRSR
jgi:hypothetical protein